MNISRDLPQATIACTEESENEVFWREKATVLEQEVCDLKLELLESETRLLEALVEERKKLKLTTDQLVQIEEKYEMSKQAMESLTTKCLQLECELQMTREINYKNEEFIEKLAAQRVADEHCKRELDQEVRKVKAQNRALTEEIGTLGLRLEISEGRI